MPSLEEILASAKFIREESIKFDAAIGRLFLSWAEIEFHLYRTLLFYTNVTHKVGRSIFSRYKASQIIDLIRTVMKSNKISKARSTDLSDVFSQITSIMTMRDTIAHHIASSWVTYPPEIFSNPKRLISKINRNNRNQDLVYAINTALVEDMISDLYEAMVHLDRHCQRKFKSASPSGHTATWLYKPPLPIENKV